MLAIENNSDKCRRLGAAIRTTRREFGWSMGAVARACGIRVSFLSDIERGEAPLMEVEYWFRPIVEKITDERTSTFGPRMWDDLI